MDGLDLLQLLLSMAELHFQFKFNSDKEFPSIGYLAGHAFFDLLNDLLWSLLRTPRKFSVLLLQPVQVALQNTTICKQLIFNLTQLLLGLQ